MPSIPVELKAPDIEPHRRSPTGTDFIHTLESGKPGPHVLVNALTHGNEICGAIVVDRLLRRGLRPVRGTLTLAFANVEAFFRFDPASPYASRFVDEDFNRVWTPDVLGGPRETAELRRARMLRPFVDAADYLLDIHSMLEPSPPVMISGPLDKGIAFAFEVGIPEHVVSDVGHANGTRMRDYGGFGDPLGAQRRTRGMADDVAGVAPPRRGGPARGRARDRARGAGAEAHPRHRRSHREIAGVPLREAIQRT